ncbi:MAG TPA: aspartate aminotransferase family protein [Candidatus Caldiarchaeum subterraneum]|uniref:Aspartate aminotransferase family protein n=1 Tax=Caldiarchaeum subterraneum TaxID=311458 RepID=A0A833A025_CALS0|nr:aspartate aminotransferase family protein [Candidatus Caldarchaeum subterraneum]
MSDKVVEDTVSFSYGTWRRQRGWKPLHVVDAEGCYFMSADGRRFLDFSSQLICSNLGHRNRSIVNAIKEYAEKLPYISPAFTCDVRAELSRMLRELVPPSLSKFFYSTSGTEANEAALKIARLYTGRYKVISRYRSYHGSTAASISVTGDVRRWYVEGFHTVPGTLFAPDPYCYRCPLGLSYPDCGVACAEYVDYMLNHEDNVSAVIVEPVVGTNGVIIPPPEYFPKLREITRKHDVLLIVDEVMSGWGRVGEWFAINHWGVEPDILTTAKGITSAYLPLGVTATSEKIASYFDDTYFAHGHTYEAHPLTMAAGVAAINEYRRLNILERVKRRGEYLGRRLKELEERHESVGEVRGMGLFWAVDLTKNRRTREPFNTFKDKYSGKQLVVDAVAAEMMRQGVYCMAWVNHLLVAPPLIVEEDEIDEGVEALDKALKIADEKTEK